MSTFRFPASSLSGIAVALMLIAACSSEPGDGAAERAATSGNPGAARSASEPLDAEAARAAELLETEVHGVEAVEPEVLEAMLPETIGGLPRRQSDSTSSSPLGVGVTIAEAGYAMEGGDARLHISLTDLGGMQGLARLGMDWIDVERSAESATAFERTGSHQGFKTFERYDKQAQQGEITVFVGDRFIIEVDAWNVPWETLTGAVEAIDFAKLEALRKAGGSTR